MTDNQGVWKKVVDIQVFLTSRYKVPASSQTVLILFKKFKSFATIFANVYADHWLTFI